jgi:hypothetical protein
VALTPGRWLLWTVVGCLGVAVGFWPPAAEPPSRFEFSYGRAGTSSRDRIISEAASRYALLLIRDSLLAHTTRAALDRPMAVPPLAPAGQPAERMRQSVDSLVGLLATGAAGVRTVILPAAASRRTLPNGSSAVLVGSWYVLPPATDGHLCIVHPSEGDLVQLRTLAVDSSHTTVAELAAKLFAVLGPCAFYSEFGAPGTEIEAWLRRSSYATTSEPDWPFATTDSASRENWNDAFLFDVPVRACAHGQFAACRELLLPRGSLPIYRNTAIVRRGYWFNSQPRYLSDLVQREGRARFLRFWASDQAPEAAFQKAFGMPMAGWTQQWMVSHASRRPRFGPGMDASAVVWSLALTAVIALGMALTATRRQVS